MASTARAQVFVTDGTTGLYGTPFGYVSSNGSRTFESYRKRAAPGANPAVAVGSVTGNRVVFINDRYGSGSGPYINPGVFAGRAVGLTSPTATELAYVSCQTTGGVDVECDFRACFAEHLAAGGGASFASFVTNHGGDNGAQMDPYWGNWGVDGLCVATPLSKSGGFWRFRINRMTIAAANSAADETGRRAYASQAVVTGATVAGSYYNVGVPDSTPLTLSWRIVQAAPNTTLEVRYGPTAVLSWTFDNGSTRTGLTNPDNPDGVGFQNGSLDLTRLIPVWYLGSVTTDSNSHNLTVDFAPTTPPATKLAFTTGPRTFTSGTCGGAASVITVQLHDASNNPVNASAGGQAFTASSTGNETWFSDATCTTAASGGTFTIPAGLSSVNLYYRDTLAGSPTVTLSNASGLTNPAGQVHTVNPGAASRLAFTTASRTFTAGVCGGAGNVINVQLRDASSNAVNASAGGQAFTASSTGNETWFSDATCTTAASGGTFTIPAGLSSVNLYYRDTLAGSPTVTLSNASGLTNPAGQGHTVNASASVRLAFITPGRSTSAGVCSAAITVQHEDAFGNPVPPGPTTVSLSSTAAGTGFFGDSSCTVPLTSIAFAAAATTVTFYARDTTAGVAQLTASAPALSAVQQAFNVTAGPPTQLVFTTAPHSVAVGACSGALTVQALDAFGNVSPVTGNESLSLSSPSAGNGFFTSGTCATAWAAPSMASGSSSFTFHFRDTVAGAPSLLVQGTLLSSASQQQTVVAGATTALRLTGLPATAWVGQALSVSVSPVDVFGNSTPAYTGTVHFSSTDATAQLPADYPFGPGDNGLHTFVGAVRFNRGGTFDVTATDLGNAAITGSQANIVVRQLQGGGCSASGECGSGSCVDAVCCDTACTGTCMACNLAGSVGTCTPEPNGASCADGTFCNGSETCQSGTCSAGTAVVCTDVNQRDVLTCDESAKSCVVVPQAPPRIVRDAVGFAGVGYSYVYNAFGAVTALGARPMSYASCGGPSGFAVDAQSGAVSWMPSATGTFPLCVRAQNPFGQDTYAFDVVVRTAEGVSPLAVLEATPTTGPAPLLVNFDGSGSTSDPSTQLVLYVWSFGAGGALGQGVTTAARYPLPGGHQASLTVTDGYGRQATAKTGIRVTSAQGLLPPEARIVASATRGEGTLTADLSCDCHPGSSPLRSFQWTLDGTTVMGQSLQHTFGPGRHHVGLTVVDDAGLTATDEVEIVVASAGREPPTCRAFATPSQGPAPLETVLRAVFAAQSGGSISDVSWQLWDGATAHDAEVPLRLELPGSYRASLLVTDEVGLRCSDELTVASLSVDGALPPTVLELPAQEGECGVPMDSVAANALPVVAGPGPYRYSLEEMPGETLPAGAGIDAETGALLWTPAGANAGENRFLVRVSTPGGASTLPVTVNVTCGESRQLRLGCGCGASTGGGGALVLGAWALSTAFRRRRRARRSPRAQRRPRSAARCEEGVSTHRET